MLLVLSRLTETPPLYTVSACHTAMANFDSNQWYHIYYNNTKTNALKGSQLFNATTQSGSTYFDSYDPKDASFQWQFYPVNNTKFYLLRTKASGADGFLGTKFAPNSDTPGHTVPRMIRGNVSDDSSLWNIGTFPDGTFFLSNKANKTTYHLTRNEKNSLASMTSKTDASLQLPGQHLSFETISAIDNDNFSTASVSLLCGILGGVVLTARSSQPRLHPRPRPRTRLPRPARVVSRPARKPVSASVSPSASSCSSPALSSSGNATGECGLKGTRKQRKLSGARTRRTGCRSPMRSSTRRTERTRRMGCRLRSWIVTPGRRNCLGTSRGVEGSIALRKSIVRRIVLRQENYAGS